MGEELSGRRGTMAKSGVPKNAKTALYGCTRERRRYFKKTMIKALEEKIEKVIIT